MVPGAFFEYTWTANERLVVVAGLRGDYHNMFGAFASPRFHMRYSLTEETSIKLVAGRGFRTANVFMEQLGTWASNRRWNIQDDLQPEVATNVGINLVSKFRLNSRDASISLDGYFTDFENRVIIDLYASPNSVQIYNSNILGSDYEMKSQSTTVQVEFDYSAHRRLDIRAAYRWVNAKTDYLDFLQDNMERDPFVAEHRAFTQWSYASKAGKDGQQTRVDATVQWVGSQRLPTPYAFDVSPEEYEDHPEFSPDFTQLNLQVTQTFKGNFELYAGVENLLDVKQHNPIVGAREGTGITDTFESSFDASLVYGPIFGRMTYAGLRWTIGG
jgi:outer membrane receptor for ferrienterochelin and colicin